MVPTRSLEEKSVIWFPRRAAISLAARPAFAEKSDTLWGYCAFRRISSQPPNLWRRAVEIRAAQSPRLWQIAALS
jgi:hypothetical protein